MWILGLCGDMLVAGQCLKPFLDAPWLGAGWLAGGLGGPGGAQDGREASEMYLCSAGELGGGRASSYRILFLRLRGQKDSRLEGLKASRIERFILELEAEGSKARRIRI